jgi:hypothetical protein
MKVAIIGSRDYAWDFMGMKPSVENDYFVGRPDWDKPHLRKPIHDAVARLTPEDYVVSGAATGADWWGEYFARQERVGRSIHPAFWSKYDTSAGMIRNRLVVDFADCVLAFFTDRTKSRGTVGAIGLAQKKGIPVYEFDALTEDRPSWYDTWYDEMCGLRGISTGDLIPA